MTRLPWPLVTQVLGVVAAGWLLVQTWQIWLLAFTALVLAAAILPAARLGERFRVPRAATVLVVYVALAGLGALMGRLLWPALREQGEQFILQLPRLVDNVRGWLGELDVVLWRWGAELPTPRPESLQGIAQALVARTLDVTFGVVGFLVGLLAIVVITAYLVVDAERVGQGLLRFLPPPARAQAATLGPAVLARLGGYVRGQIVSSLCVGALIALGLSLLGVRYSLLLGVLAAVLNVLPFVGSLVAGVLGVLSALNESLGLAAATALLFWGTNLLEGNVLAPRLVGRATGLHPLAVMLALLTGAQLAGLFGAFVAVPLLAGAWEVVRGLAPEGG